MSWQPSLDSAVLYGNAATNRGDHSAFYSAACLVISARLPACFSRAHTEGGMWAWLFIHNGCHHSVRGGIFWMQGSHAHSTYSKVQAFTLWDWGFLLQRRMSAYRWFCLEYQVACTCGAAGYRVASDESANFYEGSRARLEGFGE